MKLFYEIRSTHQRHKGKLGNESNYYSNRTNNVLLHDGHVKRASHVYQVERRHYNHDSMKLKFVTIGQVNPMNKNILHGENGIQRITGSYHSH